MHNPVVFSSGPKAVFLGSEEGLIPIQKDPPEHAAYRRMLDPLFSPQRMNALEPGLTEHTRRRLDAIAPTGRCDFVADLASPVPGGAILAMLGASLDDLPDFLDMKRDVFRPEGEVGSPERSAQIARGAQRLATFFNQLIEERVADPRDDMATHIARFEREGLLNREQSIGVCQMLLLAGIETITTAATNMIYELAQRPDLRDRIVNEPAILPAAIEEMLRVTSPIPTIPRVATEDAVVDGCPIKAGERLAVWFPISNYDGEVYKDPQKLNFDREVNRHLAFGMGKHRCLGSHLARIELTVLMREWHRRIPVYEIEPDHHVQWGRGGRELSSLPLVFPASTSVEESSS